MGKLKARQWKRFQFYDSAPVGSEGIGYASRISLKK